MPGEIEANIKTSRLVEGVLVSAGVQQNIRDVAATYGVSLPEFSKFQD
jgi:LDH2 family malate/lactate/ureidoglycolate dehydrogenase